MKLKSLIKRLIAANLDGEKTIVMTVTGEDGKESHYYIFKNDALIDDKDNVEIPIWILTKENGKGPRRHFITVSIYNNGYVVHNLNIDHIISITSHNTVRLPYSEAEEITYK